MANQFRLDKLLMMTMMRRIAELVCNPTHLLTTRDLLDIAPQSLNDSDKFFYLNRHLEFLAQLGYLILGEPNLQFSDRMIRLTATGQIFVQPELAEFANRTLLPDIIDTLEQRIRTLTYPEPEKAGWIFKLREAFAKEGPEQIVKVLFEIATAAAKLG